MRNILSKMILVIQIIAMILFFILCFFILFNSLVAYKNASGNDWINFAGGIIGSVIAGAIAVITFYYTIKNNDKNQNDAYNLQTKLNIENNNFQMALKVQDNLNKKMEVERSTLANAYNHLENFLFTVTVIQIQNDDYIEMKNNLLRLYQEFISSINNIRFNSEIFDDRSFCENCEMCEMKTFGILVKSAADIQKEILIIDEECRIVLNYLELALNTAAQSQQLINERENLNQIKINNERLLSIRKTQIYNPIGSLTPQEKKYYDEMNSLSDDILKKNQRMMEIKDLLDNNLKIISEQSSLAKTKAVQTDSKLKMQLYILIRKYFTNYNLYIKEQVYAVQKNGWRTNVGCAKLNFEKNHIK